MLSAKLTNEKDPEEKTVSVLVLILPFNSYARSSSDTDVNTDLLYTTWIS